MSMTDETDKTRTDYTKGPILRSILAMGLPSMFGFLSQNIYSMVDTYWVSKLPSGETGVAAITFFATIMWLFFSFNQLVGPGSVAIISRRYGEKAYDLAEKAIKETLILKLVFGGIFGLVGFFFIGDMLNLMGADADALAAGVEYGAIMFGGMGIIFATYSLYTGMRGVANPQMAMYLMVASNVLNMVLDPLLMFGWYGLPAWGIKGAAIASVISYGLTFLVGSWFFYAGKTNVPLTWSGKESVSISSMWALVKIGIPAWLGEMSFSSARLLVTPLIAAFGTPVVAAYGVGNQITHFGIMVLVGIGLGLSSLIGHNIGSGKIKRAKKTGDTAVWLGVAIMSFVAVITYVFAAELMGVFFEAEDTIGYGVTMLRIYAVAFPFLGAFLMMEEIHMGVGLNVPAMVVNIIHAWPLQVLPIFVLTQVYSFDQDAIWYTIAASVLVSTAMFYVYYRRGRWLTVKV